MHNKFINFILICLKKKIKLKLHRKVDLNKLRVLVAYLDIVDIIV